MKMPKINKKIESRVGSYKLVVDDYFSRKYRRKALACRYGVSEDTIKYIVKKYHGLQTSVPLSSMTDKNS